LEPVFLGLVDPYVVLIQIFVFSQIILVTLLSLFSVIEPTEIDVPINSGIGLCQAFDVGAAHVEVDEDIDQETVGQDENGDAVQV
jgi:hypothetical protein